LLYQIPAVQGGVTILGLKLMDIYPEDLGQKNCNRILNWRGMFSVSTTAIGRNFLDNESAPVGGSYHGLIYASGGFSAGLMLNVLFHPASNISYGILMGGAGSIVGYICGYLKDRRNLNQLKLRKVTPREIGLVSRAEADALKQDYLSLVSYLISTRAVYDTTEEESIRSAIQSLGAAVESLPNQPAASIVLDSETLTFQAARLTAEAAQEADSVIAASLERQSQTLTQNAETIKRSANLLRRNQVLRNEIAMQIKAMQTNLNASAIEDEYGGSEMGSLAKRIQQVATEANTLANARVELETALNFPLIGG